MTSPPTTTERRPRWPWFVLGLGLLWTAALRLPLLLHAVDHLDSDLAVDGLTLIEAVEGRWRWHYPGTPHMGSLPVVLSYPQSLIWGPGPIALVSGGLVAWLLVVLATFGLAWRAFGSVVAAWSLVPLVFSSVGAVWLSGRITGGHLLTLFWHIAALWGMVVCLSRGGVWRSGLLGLWCGLGLYLDTMFVFTLAGLGPVAVLAWWQRGRSRAGLLAALVFAVGLMIGVAPREIGRRVDPHDAYGEQFAPVLRPDVILEHGRILSMECLPRLIAGVELPELRPSPEALTRNGRPVPRSDERGGPVSSTPTLAITLGLFAVSVARLIAAARSRSFDVPAQSAIRAALVSSGLIVLAFLVNRNIFNSDNYRYLIYLILPWAIGFGLLMRSLWHRLVVVRLAALTLSVWLAWGMTSVAVGWYARLDWLEPRASSPPESSRGWAMVEVPFRQPTRYAAPRGTRWVEIPRSATHVFGDYWDVYRVAFLSEGSVVGVPFPTYPNRFKGWSSGLGQDRGELFVLDPVPGWQAMLAESWRQEGRDPAELDRISITLP